MSFAIFEIHFKKPFLDVLRAFVLIFGVQDQKPVRLNVLEIPQSHVRTKVRRMFGFFNPLSKLADRQLVLLVFVVRLFKSTRLPI